MSDSTHNASTIARLRSSAANRINDGLLASNGKVAGIGLATALLTLAFTIWFRSELAHQARFGAPLARAATELEAAIDASVSSLRGWVAYGNPDFASERAAIWRERIQPTLATLDELARSAYRPGVETQVRDLSVGLRNLARIQWAIQDVARTPGNEPATIAYQERLEPLRRSVLRHSGNLIKSESDAPSRGDSTALIGALSRFRTIFVETDLLLIELLNNYDAARDYELDERLALTTETASRLRSEAPDLVEAEQLRMLRFTLSEFDAYAAQVREVIALRKSEQWNVALSLFVDEAQPVAEQVRAAAERLSNEQTEASAARAASLAEASYAVIAMALLMGLISAGSLMVSFRLRRQVQDVMARAKKLGQYVIDERLGSGGMGDVYLAHHAMLRRPTAIKLLRSHNAQDLRAQDRFQREVQSTSQLTHPNTVEIFDYGRTPEGVFYYAMEYLDGFTLQTLVDVTGPVAPARVVMIMIQACGSLAEAHDLSLIHRDIKPSNIMLTKRGGLYDTAKILDFGLVQDLTGDGASGGDEANAIAGTPMYLAPESILSSEAGTAQSDIYALGAVAYFLLTGTTVFPSGDTVEILERHLKEVPEFPSQRLGRELPSDLEYVVMACLSKDPAERPADAGLLAEMFAACDAGSWTAADAHAWWDAYGEAARNYRASDDASRASAVRSGLDVAIESTRT